VFAKLNALALFSAPLLPRPLPYILQLHSGINLLQHPRNPNPVHFQAVLVIAFFMIAIARAWQMIGARDTGMVAVLGDLLRERRHDQTAVLPESDDEDVAGRDEQRNEKCRHCHRVIRPRAGGGLTLKVPVDRLV
jgi:hypothetical protein